MPAIDYTLFESRHQHRGHVQADAIEASAQDGVLQVLVPKAKEAHAKHIQVRAGTGKAVVTGKTTATGKAAKNGA